MTDRVLWLTKGLGLGGAERLLSLMAARLDRDRFEVDVAYLLPWKDAFVPDLERKGVTTVCLDASRTTELGWPRRFRRLLAERRYALVHTHSPVPAALARLTVRPPTMLVHTEHNLWDRYRWPTYAANALTYGRNDAVFAVSDGVADSIVRPRWLRLGKMPPVETLLHGVDADEIPRGPDARASARAVLGLEDHAPLVGCVANFTPKKDHAGLLEAIAQVRATLPDVVLVLIGSGPIEAELRARTRELRLEDNVRFLGARNDVLMLLPGLDVFVLGSRFEGLPISLLEAMAAGVACVATAVGGVPEVLTDAVDGRTVPAGDPAALATALRAVLVDAQVRSELAAAGRRRVVTSFSIDRAVRRTEALYHQLLTGADTNVAPTTKPPRDPNGPKKG
jgi:glycosyltransferase involved in cell wall biosynthesis